MIDRGALWFLAISLIIGSTVRVPLLGQSGGLLVSDAAVALLLLIASKKYYLSLHREAPAAHYLLLITPFIFWSAFTLAVNSSARELNELFVAASYWVRTSSYLLLLPALLVVVRNPLAYQTLRRSFIVCGVALAVIGLLQLIIMPRLALLPAILANTSGGGWDPHEGRLVSAWLDPNLMGSFFSIALLHYAAHFFSAGEKTQKQFFMAISGITTVSLLLTQSRSSFIALALAALILSPLILLRLSFRRRPRMLASTLSSAILAILAAGLAAFTLGDRAMGLITFDPTVRLRLQALTGFWPLMSDNSLLGVGYNAFQFAVRDAGLPSDFSLHSRAGADNSFLTLAVTTGIPGLILFCVPWLAVARQLLRRWLVQGQILALAAVTSLLSLAIHAQFINSFLYAHLLAALAIVITLALSVSPTHVQSLRL